MTVKITHWNRIETQRRTRDLSETQKATTQDPLWALCRQWQMGEFQGEDAGSPIKVDLTHTEAPLSRYHVGGLNDGQQTVGQELDTKSMPLEAHVEQPSAALDKLDIRFGVESGQVFLRHIALHLGESATSDYRQHYIEPSGLNLGVQKPPLEQMRSNKGAKFLRSSIGYALDGRRLYARLAEDLSEASSTLPTDLLVNPSDDINSNGKLSEAARSWVKWYEAQFCNQPTEFREAWRPDRLEHHFSVAAASDEQQDIVLESNYRGQGMDWHSFDERADASLGAKQDAPPLEKTLNALVPTAVSFPGMPKPRWWEFEDHQVSFPDFDVSNLDLARLFVIDFSLVYGNDWFTVPLPLKVGTVSQIKSLRVYDTFNFDDGPGAGHVVQAADTLDDAWQMYRTSAAETASSQASNNFFVLAPALARSLESEPIEKVSLIRDEVANLGWGIETHIEGAFGYTVDREERWRSTLKSPVPPEDDPSDSLKYSLSSEVPAYWYPLIPQKMETAEGLVENNLVRGNMMQQPGQAQDDPLGEFLKRMGHKGDRPGVPLPEEEAPRAGVKLTQTYQMARWIDGQVVVWRGRQRSTGRGEGASHLNYDDLK